MKRFFIFLVALMTAGLAFGQNFVNDVRLSLNKGIEGIYSKGEPVIVFAEVEKETSALVKVFHNGIIKESRETVLPAGKSEVFNQAYNESVAIMVCLANPTASKDSTTIGAIVAPEEFTPGFEEPEDFDEFWNHQLKALRKMKMKVKFSPVEVTGEDGENYVCYDLEINCVGKAPVRGYVAMPKDAKPKSLPIAMFFHSAHEISNPHTRSSISTAVRMAKYGNGAIGADINAHGLRGDQDSTYYQKMEKKLGGYQIKTAKGHKDFYFRTMFLRDIRALDFLCTLEEWDGKRVLVTGGSQGGAQSAAVAGLDSRVTHIVVDVPAMWGLGGNILGRLSAWPKYIEKYGPSSSTAIISPYYDGCNFMRHFKGSLIVNVGLIDHTCPPAEVWSAYNVCPASSKVIRSCCWRSHTGYSIPLPERKKIRVSTRDYLDEARNVFLQ